MYGEPVLEYPHSIGVQPDVGARFHADVDIAFGGLLDKEKVTRKAVRLYIHTPA
jgi:hypothetical protein